MAHSLTAKIPVELSQIEPALMKLWQQTEDDAAGDGGGARVLLSNFIIICDAETSLSSVEEFITELCIAYPSRFFVVDLEGAATGRFETSISSRCVTAQSGAHVCSEEVYLAVSKDQLRRLPNLLLSLLVPDIPTSVLYFPGFEPHLYPVLGDLAAGLSKIAGAIVYDSVGVTDYHAQIGSLVHGKLSQVLDASMEPVRIRDLNWYRMQKWRELIAEQFDSDCLRGYAGRIRRAVLEVSVSDGVNGLPPIAYLFLGWFCAALSWEVKTAETHQEAIIFYCRHSSAEDLKLEVHIRPHAKNSEKRLIGFSLEIAGDESPAKLEVHRIQSQAEVCTRRYEKGTENSYSRRVPFPSLELPALLLKALTAAHDDEIFKAALQSSLRFTHTE